MSVQTQDINTNARVPAQTQDINTNASVSTLRTTMPMLAHHRLPGKHPDRCSPLRERLKAKQLQTCPAKTSRCCLGCNVLAKASMEQEASILQTLRQHRRLMEDKANVKAPLALGGGQGQQVLFKLGVFNSSKNTHMYTHIFNNN